MWANSITDTLECRCIHALNVSSLNHNRTLTSQQCKTWSLAQCVFTKQAARGFLDSTWTIAYVHILHGCMLSPRGYTSSPGLLPIDGWAMTRRPIALHIGQLWSLSTYFFCKCSDKISRLQPLFMIVFLAQGQSAAATIDDYLTDPRATALESGSRPGLRVWEEHNLHFL